MPERFEQLGSQLSLFQDEAFRGGWETGLPYCKLTWEIPAGHQMSADENLLYDVVNKFLKRGARPFCSWFVEQEIVALYGNVFEIRVIEGEKERIQQFQGIVISRKGSGLNETFTVRKISEGVGVERIFPVHSPRIAKIDKVRDGNVRRAKLYYLRNLTGKGVRQKTR